MAVNKDNKSTPSNPAMAEAMKESGAQQSRSTNQNQPNRGRNVEGPKSLAGLNSLFSNPMTRSTAGEVTGELTQTLRKILSSERNSVLEKVTIEPVDGDSHSLALSVIVLRAALGRPGGSCQSGAGVVSKQPQVSPGQPLRNPS